MLEETALNEKRSAVSRQVANLMQSYPRLSDPQKQGTCLSLWRLLLAFEEKNCAELDELIGRHVVQVAHRRLKTS